MAKVKAALLDERGVFWRMDELEDESQLTALHLPKITECDLRPGQYRWQADAANPHGGAFVPLPRSKRKAAPETPDLEEAFYALAKGHDSPTVRAWCAYYEQSLDRVGGKG